MTKSTGAPRCCTRNKLIAGVTGVLLAACVFACLFLIPWRWHDDVIRNVRIWQMTPAQRQCAEQFASNLAFVEQQADGNSVAIGYLVGDDYYVAMYSIGAQGQCDVEFHEKAGTLETRDAGTSWERKAELVPQAIREVRVSNGASPDIYVWFDALGVNRGMDAKHIFFVKQPDSSFKAALLLEMCAGSSSVQITNERGTPSIVVTNTRFCDWPPDHRISYVEYSLSDGTSRMIRWWSTGDIP